MKINWKPVLTVVAYIFYVAVLLNFGWLYHHQKSLTREAMDIAVEYGAQRDSLRAVNKVLCEFIDEFYGLVEAHLSSCSKFT